MRAERREIAAGEDRVPRVRHHAVGREARRAVTASAAAKAATFWRMVLPERRCRPA
jgi:hypothetical protein